MGNANHITTPRLEWCIVDSRYSHLRPYVGTSPVPSASDFKVGSEIIVMLANHREIWTCTRGIHGNEWTRNASPRRGKSFTTVTDRDIRGVVKWAITHIPE